MKILKAIGAAVLAVATCFSARAEETLVKTPLILDGVEAGYTVTGLPNDEVAVVFTNHVDGAMTWTAPTYLENVQFLVVGGGGSGRAGTWGGGGGGGGVVTGLVNYIAKNAEVIAFVGKGGAKVSGNGTAGIPGDDSYFTVGGLEYVRAYGGGNGKTGNGASGGSGGGAGPGTSQYYGGSATQGSFDETYVTGWKFGEKGGDGIKSATAGGGGGGATTAGYSPSAGNRGGVGGAGLTSDITGKSVVYGSGGGGGGSYKGASGGSGAGAGANGTSTEGTSGVANRGGGGGGGGQWQTSYRSGAGGSGVVVLRYTVPDGAVEVPRILSKVYNAATQTADVPTAQGYTVTQNNGGIDVGSYDVVLTPVAGYSWLNDSTDPLTVKFNIIPGENEWTVEPAITKGSWTANVDEPGVLTPAATKFDQVSAVITKDGGAATAFEGTVLPTDPGEYVITYTIPTSANYTDPDVTAKSVSFTITSADEVPVYEISLGDLSVSDERVMTVPYTLICESTTTKSAMVYALYALDGDSTTNVAQIATGASLNGSGSGTISDMKPGATYWVAVYGSVDNEQSEPTEFKSVTVPGPATDFDVDVTFTNQPDEFVITGSGTPGIGVTTVTVYWSLNSDALDNSETFMFNPDEVAAFVKTIPYYSIDDILTYKISVTTTVETETYGSQSWEYSSDAVTKTRVDTSKVTYTWTGEGGDNLWTNAANWSASVGNSYGYPNSKYAVAKFTTPGVDVNLDGRTVTLSSEFTATSDTSTGFVFSQNLGEVNFRNGKIYFSPSGNSFGFGAKGTTLIFDTVQITGLKFMTCPNSTVVFTGSYDLGFSFYPWEHLSDSTLIFRDGDMSCEYGGSWLKESYDIYIENAKWTLTNPINDNSLASRIHFVDGEGEDGRQAQLVVNGAIRLKNTYNIRIPRDGHKEASIIAKTKYDQPSCTIKLDVSDYKSGKPVPLVRYTSSTDQALSTDNLTLAAYEDGVNVTEKRNARLVWSGDDNTLYYKQDSQTGFSIIIR